MGKGTKNVNTSLKEVKGDVGNKSFFNLFWKSKTATEKIGYFGQIVSGATEFVTAYNLCGGSFPPTYNIRDIVAILVGLFLVYIFEVVGVRTYLVSAVRQIVNSKNGFKGGESVMLFVFNVLFIVLLCGSNLLMSIVGQESMFLGVKTKDNSKEVQRLDSLEFGMIAKADRLYFVKDSLVRVRHYKSVKAVELSYSVDIKELKSSRYAVKINGGSKSDYKGYTEQIDSKLREKGSRLDTLSSRFDSELERIANDKGKAITSIKEMAKRRKDALLKNDNVHSSFWNMASDYTRYILVFFIILSWIAIIYDEIFIKGSRIDVEQKEVVIKPNLLFSLIRGVWNRIYHVLYVITSFIVGRNYSYKNLESEVVEYKPTSLKKSVLSFFAPAKDFDFGVRNENRSDENRSGENRRIGFKIGRGKDIGSKGVKASSLTAKGLAVCKNCGTHYVKNHHKQLYCSTSCRVSFWEQKTGKKLYIKSNK